MQLENHRNSAFDRWPEEPLGWFSWPMSHLFWAGGLLSQLGTRNGELFSATAGELQGDYAGRIVRAATELCNQRRATQKNKNNERRRCHDPYIFNYKSWKIFNVKEFVQSSNTSHCYSSHKLEFPTHIPIQASHTLPTFVQYAVLSFLCRHSAAVYGIC